VITHRSTFAVPISSNFAYNHTLDNHYDNISWIRTRATKIVSIFEMNLGWEKDMCQNVFACIQSQTHKRDRETKAKAVNLSPPRFSSEINLKFNITCVISRPNFLESVFSINAIFSLEYAINHRFFEICRRKIYLLLVDIMEFT
jgi:hypothetical protein